jgi:predicted SnoaL-like aldol condensation-catalyzing enzyme
MSRSNKQVVQGFFDDLTNSRRFDLWDEYLSPEAIAHGTPYVGVGVIPDYSTGDKIVLAEVAPGSPADGNLQAGDVLLRVEDGAQVTDTYDQLKQALWGQGKIGTSLKIKVSRGGEELDFEVERGLIPGFDVPIITYKDMWQSSLEKDWREFNAKVECLVEEGDLVVAMVTNSGLSVEFNQRATWSEFDLFRLKDGKIVESWSLEDTFTQYKQLGYTILPPEK